MEIGEDLVRIPVSHFSQLQKGYSNVFAHWYSEVEHLFHAYILVCLWKNFVWLYCIHTTNLNLEKGTWQEIIEWWEARVRKWLVGQTFDFTPSQSKAGPSKSTGFWSEATVGEKLQNEKFSANRRRFVLLKGRYICIAREFSWDIKLKEPKDFIFPNIDEPVWSLTHRLIRVNLRRRKAASRPVYQKVSHFSEALFKGTWLNPAKKCSSDEGTL